MLIWSTPLMFRMHCHNPANIFPPVTIDRFMQSRNHQIVGVAEFSETMPTVSPSHDFELSTSRLTSHAQSSQAHSIEGAYRDALHTAFKKPSFCANRFNESSLSPIALTKPQRAYVWFSPVYRPFSSTLATEIWTEA